MIRQLAALLHRDHDLERVECGIADGFVFVLDRDVDDPAQAADVPCRDTATWRVAFHCPGCQQPYLRLTCDHHRRVLAQDPHATCEHCLTAGRTVRPIWMWSVAVDAPTNPAYAKEN